MARTAEQRAEQSGSRFRRQQLIRRVPFRQPEPIPGPAAAAWESRTWHWRQQRSRAVDRLEHPSRQATSAADGLLAVRRAGARMPDLCLEEAVQECGPRAATPGAWAPAPCALSRGDPTFLTAPSDKPKQTSRILKVEARENRFSGWLQILSRRNEDQDNLAQAQTGTSNSSRLPSGSSSQASAPNDS